MMTGDLGASVTEPKVDMPTLAALREHSTNRPLTVIGRTGLFVKELKQAFLDGWVDLAEKSLKDLLVEEKPDLTMRAGQRRAPTFDAAVLCRANRNRCDPLPGSRT